MRVCYMMDTVKTPQHQTANKLPLSVQPARSLGDRKHKQTTEKEEIHKTVNLHISED